MTNFYDQLSPLYHLIYENWNASVRRQGEQLAAVIEAEWPGSRNLLDVSCGIGTQAIGLAMQGFSVSGSDISEKEVDRAKQEASKQGVHISFSVSDVRNVTAALDATGNTNGNVTLRIDLLEGGYAAMDNFVIAASDTAGRIPGDSGLPLPSILIAGLVLLALLLLARAVRRAAGQRRRQLKTWLDCGRILIPRRRRSLYLVCAPHFRRLHEEFTLGIAHSIS